MKSFRYIMSAAMLLLMLTGCAEKTPTENEVTESSAVEEISAETEETDVSEDETEKDILDRAVVRTGNNYLLKQKLSELSEGKDIKISYIGGSITYGIGTTPEKCWAKRSFDMICERYGGAAVYNNAGISGTPSVLGNIRAERDIPDSDIAFVEFAVNDGTEDIYKESFECLVRSLTEKNCAVIIIINRTEQGHTCREYMMQVSEFYDLPVISVNDSISYEMENGRMVWDDYSADSSHPNEYGHSLIADMVMRFFEHIDSEETDEPFVMPDGFKYGLSYYEPTYINTENPEFVESTGCFVSATTSVYNYETSWQNTGTGEPLVINCNAKGFFVVYKRNNNGNMGSFDVLINGIKIKTIDSNDSEGWGDPFVKQIIKFQDEKEMKIEIVPTADSVEKEIEIIGVALF